MIIEIIYGSPNSIFRKIKMKENCVSNACLSEIAVLIIENDSLIIL